MQVSGPPGHVVIVAGRLVEMQKCRVPASEGCCCETGGSKLKRSRHAAALCTSACTGDGRRGALGTTMQHVQGQIKCLPRERGNEWRLQRALVLGVELPRARYQ
jgi:hypothetical protein